MLLFPFLVEETDSIVTIYRDRYFHIAFLKIFTNSSNKYKWKWLSIILIFKEIWELKHFNLHFFL